jgi:hypothetical protein
VVHGVQMSFKGDSVHLNSRGIQIQQFREQRERDRAEAEWEAGGGRQAAASSIF